MCKIAPIGKLKHTHPALVTCLYHLLGHSGILVVKHGHHARITHFS